MNVENRKLFRNKDARARLAGMGGIIASSPELLGTVQKFQDAGPVVPSTFLVQLPGLVGGNEFLQLTAAELQLLNEKQPGLMSSEGVMIQEATPEILATLNPAQYNTTKNPNIKRMFADLGVTLPESSVGAEGPSNRALAFEKLKEQLSNLSFFPERTEGTVDTGPGFFSPESNAVRLSAVKELMFGPEEQQAPQQQTMTEESVVNPSLLSGNNFSNDPTTGYSYPTDIVANMMPPQTNTPPVESGITSLPVTPENQNIADNLRFDFLDNFKMNTTDGRTPSLRNDMVKMAGDFSEAERMLLNAPRSNVLPDKPVSEMSVSELESKQISSSKPIGTFFNNMYNSIKKSDAGFTSSMMGVLGTAASAPTHPRHPSAEHPPEIKNALICGPHNACVYGPTAEFTRERLEHHFA